MERANQPALVVGSVSQFGGRAPSRRVGGVYFALLTQALSLAFSTLLISQQKFTGGFNGLTDFNELFGFALGDPKVQLVLYWITLAFLASAFFFSDWLL